MKTIGIYAHSYEGGSLCFLEACREGEEQLGPHMHPEIVLSAIPMGLSMNGWESDNHKEVAEHLLNGIEKLKDGGVRLVFGYDQFGKTSFMRSSS